MKENFEILNTLPDSIAIINDHGEIVFTNTKWKSFGKENNADERFISTGVNYFDSCTITKDETDAKRATHGISQVLEGKKMFFEMEYPCHSPSENRWFILRAIKIKKSNINLISHINITKRREAERKVEMVNKQMIDINRRLMSATNKIAHDIQGPLGAIEGIVKYAKNIEDTTELNNMFDIMEESVRNLKAYVQETVELSKKEGVPERVDLKEELEKVIQSLNPEKAGKLTITYQVLQQDEFWLLKEEFTTICSNLITNAIKYSDPKKNKSNLHIQLKADKSHLGITFSDNGIGIDKENIELIFSLGFQVKPTNSEGAGLGLAIVQSSVKSLGGNVVVFSQLGVGTTFEINMPNMIPD